MAEANGHEIFGFIYVSKNYSEFKEIEFNRDVKSIRKDRLVASFKKGEVLNPIVVNEKMEIIDGQGRYEARKELGLPIVYVISKGATVDDCRRMNQFNSPWTSTDFIISYAESGNENYQWLLKSCKETENTPTRAMRMASIGTHSSAREIEKSKIISGSLEFSKDDYEKVIDVSAFSKDVIDALAFSARPNEAFYTATIIASHTKGFDKNSFIMNCKKCRNSYAQASRLEDELKEFSKIYNYRRKSGKIYFEDYMRNRGYNSGRTYDEFADRLNSENKSAKTLGKDVAKEVKFEP